MINNIFANSFNLLITQTALENKETCHHWIDYEIYQKLTKLLKIKYIKQFETPQLLYQPPFADQPETINIRCRCNHLDSYNNNNMTLCTEFYPKTIEQLKERFKNRIIFDGSP